MNVSDSFRFNLQRIRKERGLDKANLARAAGLNARAVDDIENGASKNPTLRTAVALADQLDVNILELIGRPQKASPIREWLEFLSRYSEDDQRTLLAAVRSLQLPGDE